MTQGTPNKECAGCSVDFGTCVLRCTGHCMTFAQLNAVLIDPYTLDDHLSEIEEDAAAGKKAFQKAAEDGVALNSADHPEPERRIVIDSHTVVQVYEWQAGVDAFSIITRAGGCVMSLTQARALYAALRQFDSDGLLNEPEADESALETVEVDPALRRTGGFKPAQYGGTSYDAGDGSSSLTEDSFVAAAIEVRKKGALVHDSREPPVVQCCNVPDLRCLDCPVLRRGQK